MNTLDLHIKMVNNVGLEVDSRIDGEVCYESCVQL